MSSFEDRDSWESKFSMGGMTQTPSLPSYDNPLTAINYYSFSRFDFDFSCDNTGFGKPHENPVKFEVPANTAKIRVSW